jgi:hypothetical protein
LYITPLREYASEHIFHLSSTAGTVLHTHKLRE